MNLVDWLLCSVAVGALYMHFYEKRRFISQVHSEKVAEMKRKSMLIRDALNAT